MENRKCEWVGTECGHHATYTFYKAVKYFTKPQEGGAKENQNQKTTNSAKEGWKVLSLGQFFFVKIWAGSDLLSVAELQLLWEDKTTGQMMSSVRLYFLPEYTTDGRQPHHGEDELVAVAEKSVLRVPDLLDWLANPRTITWDRGTRGAALRDCDPPSQGAKDFAAPPDQKLGPGPGLDLSEVDKVRAEIGDEPSLDEPGVVVVSASQYCRFRGVLKRLDGAQDKWLRNSLIVALGGFAAKTRNTFVMFAKEIFDYPELEEHPLLCNHLAPKLKGRPRKRRKIKEGGGAPNSPDGSEHESNSSEGSSSAIQNNKIPLVPARSGSRKDLLAILSQKNTKEETEFLRKLIKFMEGRNTPIERPPMLGFKQIDLHMFFQKVIDLGGYDGCVSKKAWKSVYDELGGNPQNTSAATCTRRHYEKFLLSYEKYAKNMELDVEDAKTKLDDISDKSDVCIKAFDNDKMESKQHENNRLNSNGTNGVKDASSENMVQDFTKTSLCKSEKAREGEMFPTTQEKPGEDTMETKKENVESKPKENYMPKIGIKSLQLLTEPKLVNNTGKEDVKLKIDDLIIIPNNINHVEEGGSALQNLAKIASRYSSLNKDKSRAQDFASPSPKKPRIEDKPNVAQPLPPTTITKKAGIPGLPGLPGAAHGQSELSNTAATSLLQQFSLLSPGMFPGWPGAATPSAPAPTSSTPTITSNRNANSGWMGSGYNLDPAKIGQEGYNLLKYYEQQLKALQQGTSSPKLNGLKETSPSKKETKSKEKSKVSKPPPDTKRPPRLIQTPCPYSQTSSIYGSPKSELQKAKDVVAKSAGGQTSNSSRTESVLDLSSTSKVEYKAPPPPTPMLQPNFNRQPESDGILNLSRSEKPLNPSTNSDFTVDLSIRRNNVTPQKAEVKASPFSAEALLSKPNSNIQKNESPKSLPPLSMGIKGILETDSRKNSPQSSPALPRASPALPRASPALPRASPAPSHHSTHSPALSDRPQVTSPWHLPSQATSHHPKLAASVTPNIRSTPSSSMSIYSSGYLPTSMSLPPSSSLPGLSTETTFSSLSSLPSSSLQPSSLQQGSNPYLSALMSPSLHGHPKPQMPGYPGINPMDPASQYYAALYQQQMSAYQHAATAAALSPYGIRQGYPSSGASVAAEMQALQQYKDMMTRAALGGSSAGLGGSANQAAAAAAAMGVSSASQAAAMSASAASSAANPYAALYAGLMGYPSGFPGQRKDQ